jgi:hypothetical protein
LIAKISEGKSICLLCIEVAKENIKPKDFWRNYREIIGTSHEKEVIEAIKKTSDKYQIELTNDALFAEGAD